MQTASSKFWTRVIASISYDSNHYATSSSWIFIFFWFCFLSLFLLSRFIFLFLFFFYSPFCSFLFISYSLFLFFLFINFYIPFSLIFCSFFIRHISPSIIVTSKEIDLLNQFKILSKIVCVSLGTETLTKCTYASLLSLWLGLKSYSRSGSLVLVGNRTKRRKNYKFKAQGMLFGEPLAYRFTIFLLSTYSTNVASTAQTFTIRKKNITSAKLRLT